MITLILIAMNAVVSWLAFNNSRLLDRLVFGLRRLIVITNMIG